MTSTTSTSTSTSRAPDPPYVLVNRRPAQGDAWVVVLLPPPFDPATFEVTLDLLGGRSGLLVYQPPSSATTLEAHLAELERLAHAVSADRVSLLAPGVAAGLALHGAIAFPDLVDRVALVSPSFPRNIALAMGLPSTLAGAVASSPQAMKLTSRHELVSRAPLLVRVLSRLGVQVPRMPADATPLPHAQQDGALLADAIARARAPQLERIRQPALVVSGARDAAFPPAAARALVRRLGHGEHFPVPGATQSLALEYPDLLAVRLEAFFS